MLDKRLPYFNIIMACGAEQVRSIQTPPLPEGFSFRLYRPGDMARWAEIEHAVDEFSTVEAAADYFSGHYLPYEDEMEERCCFVIDPGGGYAATATAWHFDHPGAHWAALNWVAVKPGFQGMGLGRSVVCRAMSLFPALEPGEDIYLHTQTWSHKAVELYLSLGFQALKTAPMAHYHNEFDLAADAMAGFMSPPGYRRFVDTAAETPGRPAAGQRKLTHTEG